MNTSTINEISIRFATIQDVPQIFQFIKELAIYEKLLDEVCATEELLSNSIFVDKKAEVIFAELDNKPVGFALFFHNFSTFLGKPGIYIEDLFVPKEYRGLGIGKSLLRFLAKLAVERNCGRLEWWCLDWNTPSINFYNRMGAKQMSEWTVFRITGKTLTELAME